VNQLEPLRPNASLFDEYTMSLLCGNSEEVNFKAENLFLFTKSKMEQLHPITKLKQMLVMLLPLPNQFAQKKPNILFIMGDIFWFNVAPVRRYHGLSHTI
jgi:hypothetical protein